MIQQIDIVNRTTPKQTLNATYGNSESVTGYGLWIYKQNQWSLLHDHSKPGYRASAAPVAPGSFDGQLRATLSEPETSVTPVTA